MVEAQTNAQVIELFVLYRLEPVVYKSPLRATLGRVSTQPTQGYRFEVALLSLLARIFLAGAGFMSVFSRHIRVTSW